MNTLKELLVGKKVRAGEDCGIIKARGIYTIRYNEASDRFFIGSSLEDGCPCIETWQLIEPIIPVEHKHTFICKDCGEEIERH